MILAAHVRDLARRRAGTTVVGTGRSLDVFRAWLRSEYGTSAVPPDTLSLDLLDRYYDATATGLHGRPRLLETRRRLVQIVERAWAWAANRDEFCRLVPPARRTDYATDPARPVAAPTWAEMDACLDACQGWQRQLGLVLRFTGLRVQQAMGLRWDDLDMDAATLRVRGELGKSRRERAGRTIPVSRHLVALVAGWGLREDWLVPCGRDIRLARSRDMARAWKRAGVRQEVWRQRPDHAFRHGFVSELKRAGADTEAVEALVGHRLPGERETYVDRAALAMRQAVDLIPPIGILAALPLRREG